MSMVTHAISLQTDTSTIKLDKVDIISLSPKEIAFSIFNFCYAKDVVRSERVCKNWKTKVTFMLAKHIKFQWEEVLSCFFTPPKFKELDEAREAARVKFFFSQYYSQTFSLTRVQDSIKPTVYVVSSFSGVEHRLYKKGYSCKIGRQWMHIFSLGGSSNEIGVGKFERVKSRIADDIDDEFRYLWQEENYVNVKSLENNEMLFTVPFSNREILSSRIIGIHLVLISRDASQQYMEIWKGNELIKEYSDERLNYLWSHDQVVLLTSDTIKCIVIGEEITTTELKFSEEINQLSLIGRKEDTHFAFLETVGKKASIIKWQDSALVPTTIFTFDDYLELEKILIWSQIHGETCFLFFKVAQKPSIQLFKHIFSEENAEDHFTLPLPEKNDALPQIYGFRNLSVFFFEKQIDFIDLARGKYFSVGSPISKIAVLHSIYKNLIILENHKDINSDEKEISIFIIDLLKIDIENRTNVCELEDLEAVISLSFNIPKGQEISEWFFDGKALVGITKDFIYRFSYPFVSDQETTSPQPKRLKKN